MKLFDDTASTYKSDLELFETLGLTPFKGIPTHKEYAVGLVDREHYSVEISVEPWPAQFWRFRIFNKETKLVTYEVSTGSGALENFWTSVEMLAEGMLIVELKHKVKSFPL